MTSFKEFLEQRDPELYEQMLNEGLYDYLKKGAAIGTMALGMLGGGEAQAQDYLPSYPKPSIVQPSDDPYGNIAGRAKHMLGQDNQVTSKFELEEDNHGIAGITFTFEIPVYIDPSRISKQDYDPSATIKYLISKTLNGREFKNVKLNLLATKRIFINGEGVLTGNKLPVHELNLFSKDPKKMIFNNIIETEYKRYSNVKQYPKTGDKQTMTIEFSFR
jgi:hypothetical protein